MAPKKTTYRRTSVIICRADSVAVHMRRHEVALRKVAPVVTPVTAPVLDADKLLHDFSDSLDKKVRNVDTGRRADILVSLPAALCTIVPVLLVGLPCILVMFAMTCPLLYKITRKL